MHINSKPFFSLLFFLFFIACSNKQTEVDFTSNNCSGSVPFVKKVIPNSAGVAFSTSEPKQKGLWLVNAALAMDNTNRKIYQDSTWKMAGWLGPLLTDANGTVWCAPVPVINVLDNKPADQNKLYRVDPNTGKMELFLALPKGDSTIENPYGILGLGYNCEAKVLYVSSVAGSTRAKQQGKIYCINIADKKIQSTLNCGDAFGLGVSYKDGYRKLYFGSARTSQIYSVALKANGSFAGEPMPVFSLDGLGPRGDDKAKKIREDKNGNLIVSGYEFNFNLTAPTERQENTYTFQYSAVEEKWVNK